VNVPILEACAAIGVIAEVVVTVVLIAREVAVRAAEEASAKAAVSIVIAVKAVVSIVVPAKTVVSIVGTAAKAGAVRFGPTEAAQMRTSEPSHGAAAGTLAPKSSTGAAATESTAHVAVSESNAAHVAASESDAASMTAAASESPAASMTAAATAASESSAASMTATTAATSDRPGGQGVRPHCCAERDGDEEDHDSARDRLLLDAAR
jgi:hypothetical protein